MIFINPWVFYDEDDIPDLTPHDDEEMVECLGWRLWFYCINHNLCVAILFVFYPYKRYTKANFNYDR